MKIQQIFLLLDTKPFNWTFEHLLINNRDLTLENNRVENIVTIGNRITVINGYEFWYKKLLICDLKQYTVRDCITVEKCLAVSIVMLLLYD